MTKNATKTEVDGVEVIDETGHDDGPNSTPTKSPKTPRRHTLRPPTQPSDHPGFVPENRMPSDRVAKRAAAKAKRATKKPPMAGPPTRAQRASMKKAKATKATAAKAKETETKTKPEPDATMKNLQVGQLPHAYGADLALRGKTEKTIASYKADLRVAAKHFGEETKISTLTAAQVADYFESDRVCLNRQGKRRSEITIAKVRRTFRMAIERFGELGATVPDLSPKS